MKQLGFLLLPFLCLAQHESTSVLLPDTSSIGDASMCCASPRNFFPGDFDTSYGFRGIPFGTSRIQFRGLGLKHAHGRNSWYQIEGGYRIGNAKLKSLEYGFRDDRFYGVYALPQDYRDYTLLKSMIDSVYGVPMHTDSTEGSITYLWNVPDVSCKLRLYWGSHRMDDRNNEMVFSLISIPIARDD